MTITFKLKYRTFAELTSECLTLLDKYKMGKISYTEAHNGLIMYGFNLKEDNTIIDF